MSTWTTRLIALLALVGVALQGGCGPEPPRVTGAEVTLFEDAGGGLLTVEQALRFEVTRAADVQKLAGYFPQMGRGGTGGDSAGWMALAEITFATADGRTVVVSVPANPIYVWSEGQGDWPADPGLKRYLRSLAARYRAGAASP